MPTRSARINQIAFNIKHGRNKSAARLFSTHSVDLRQQAPSQGMNIVDQTMENSELNIANMIDRRTIKSSHVATRQRAAILGQLKIKERDDLAPPSIKPQPRMTIFDI